MMSNDSQPTNSNSSSTHRSTTTILTDDSQKRLWVVCESGHRWITAVRRFATELMPNDLAASIVAAQPNQALALLVDQQKIQQRTQQRLIVLWEIAEATIDDNLHYISRTSIATDNTLQLAVWQAGSSFESISGPAAAALTELGVTAAISQVEQLPGLSRLIHRFLA